MRQRRVESGEHTVEEGRIERPLVSVDDEEIEILDDGAEIVLVRPEGEGERLIVEFEGAIFFGAQALQNGEIDAIGLPSQFGTEFGRTLFSVVVDEDRHIFVVTAPLLAGRCASCGRTPSCCGVAGASCSALPCGVRCARCGAATPCRVGCLRGVASRCGAATPCRVGCLRCVVVAVKLFHSENVFVAIEFLNSLVNVCFTFSCASASSQRRVVLEKTTCHFKENDVLF